jgi:hypothetical protein
VIQPLSVCQIPAFMRPMSYATSESKVSPVPNQKHPDVVHLSEIIYILESKWEISTTSLTARRSLDHHF